MHPKEGRWWLTHGSQETVIDATPDHIYDMVADRDVTSG